jgi:hypothetical protein
MKYPFEYKKAEKNLAEIGVRPYTSKGMHFTKFIYIKVSDVINDYKNTARALAIVSAAVAPIMYCIRNESYRGYAFAPPVVNYMGVLIAGHHRLQAHKGEQQEYMWVALCSFDDEKSEWLYNSLENQVIDTFDAIELTVPDLISSTLVGWNKGYFKSLDELEDHVKGYKKPPSEIRVSWETVLTKIGIEIDTHRFLTPKDIANEYGQETSGTKHVHQQANLAIKDSIFNNQRLLTTLLPLITEGINVNCIFKTNLTIDLKHLNEERKRLTKEMNPYFLYDIMKPFMDACENGTVGSVTLNFPKQYESDSWKLGVETSNE